MVGKEQSSKVFVQEEVTRMEGWLVHGQLIQVLRDRVGFRFLKLQVKFTVCGGWLLARHQRT